MRWLPGRSRPTLLAMVLDDPAIRTALEEGTPLRRVGLPDEIAAAVLYLATPASAYMTGQILAVDGGLSTTNMPMPFGDL